MTEIGTTRRVVRREPIKAPVTPKPVEAPKPVPAGV